MPHQLLARGPVQLERASIVSTSRAHIRCHAHLSSRTSTLTPCTSPSLSSLFSLHCCVALRCLAIFSSPSLAPPASQLIASPLHVSSTLHLHLLASRPPSHCVDYFAQPLSFCHTLTLTYILALRPRARPLSPLIMPTLSASSLRR
jgi:hypothetical protein